MKYQLHCFGKLPIYSDYVTFECTGPAGAAFRDWLDVGFNSFAKKSDGPFNGRYRIVSARGGWKEVVIATLRDSADQGHLRRFPFSIYLTVPAKTIQKKASYLSFLGLESLVKRLDETDRQVADFSGLAEVYTHLGGFELKKDEVQEVGMGLKRAPDFDRPLQEFIEALGGADDNSPFNCLTWGIRTLGGVEENWLDRSALRVPLAAGFDPAFQIDLWLALLHRWRRGAGFEGVPRLFSAIYPSEVTEDPGYASIFFDRLIPEHAAFFNDPLGSLPGMVDLTGHSGSLVIDGFYSFCESLGQAVKSPGLTVGSLLGCSFEPSGKVSLHQ